MELHVHGKGHNPPWSGVKAATYREGKLVNVEYYGGKDDVYEAIKVIDAWDLNFNLGNVLKYIKRAGKKQGSSREDDLMKAYEYLGREVNRAKR